VLPLAAIFVIGGASGRHTRADSAPPQAHPPFTDYKLYQRAGLLSRRTLYRIRARGTFERRNLQGICAPPGHRCTAIRRESGIPSCAPKTSRLAVA